jgi:hypothetical protein
MTWSKRDEWVFPGDGTLVFRSADVIEGAEPSLHRPSLLVVDGVQWRLLDHRREGRLHVYVLGPWDPGPFENAGVVIAYDPHRVRHARAETLALAARTVLLAALMPCAPFMGALPEGAKRWLRDRALLSPAAQEASLFVEWLLFRGLTATAVLSFISGPFRAWVAFGVSALLVVVGIAHPIALLAEGRELGMFAWLVDLVRSVHPRQSFDDRALPPASLPSNPGGGKKSDGPR